MSMNSHGLLIVDLQWGFSPREDLVSSISSLAQSYNTVVMTQFHNSKNSLYRKVLGWDGDGGPLCLNIPSALIMKKSGYGLSSDQIRQIISLKSAWHMCGLETDACVLACAFQLWDAGVPPEVLLEYCDSPMHACGKAVIARQFGKARGSS